MLSGMIGATKNMVVQYIILIIAFLIPTFLMTYKFDYFWLLPQFGYGSIVSDIVQGIPAPNLSDGVALLNAYGHNVSMVPSPEFAMPWDPSTGSTAFQWMAICFSLMLGTAGLTACFAALLYYSYNTGCTIIMCMGIIFYLSVILECTNLFGIWENSLIQS